MKKLFLIILCTLSLLYTRDIKAAGYYANSDDLDVELASIIMSLDREISVVYTCFISEESQLYRKLVSVKNLLTQSSTLEQKVDLLVRKSQIIDDLSDLRSGATSEISKIRYIKGLQIIRILYDKTLALDHHFTSVSTLNEIHKMSNPNQYPEFAAMKGVISEGQNKKEGFNISTLLGNNIYTSVIHSFVSLFNAPNSSKKEKEASLEEIECILDFTLRMHNDLNTIYFETSFLQKSNESIMNDLLQLFVDYTKPIGYKTPLKECRITDDWDLVRSKLNEYIEEMSNAALDDNQKYRAHKMIINLEFPIDRLLQFITQYNAFIDQGGKFYEKFAIMLNSYENEKQCGSKIPHEYKSMKEGIAISIEKFNTAYRPVEINGSKMKEVIYGLNEYD